ncbi:large, multi funcation alhypothetical protein [Haloferula helveola]|uniref:ThuA-like domain-containing protein n=1 Tax=Haloferula helveola TaxID=490095 RepID=A0ABM7R6N4_9BACT|nr:large, multi funcation alhypothetical protein [Haloferula helveola]
MTLPAISKLIFLAAAALIVPLPAAEEFYTRESIPLPGDSVPEVGSIALLPDQRLAISTRRGEIWIAEGAFADDLSKVRWTRFAYGLESSFGMFWKDGWLYVTQRTDLSRLQDRDGDGEADRFEVISQDWGFDGDYHQFAFGSNPDHDGNVWVALCELGGKSKWRGWAVMVKPDGTTLPMASGLRSPGGLGFNAKGDAFCTDNQGTWNGSSSLRHLKPGSFQGMPSSLHHYDRIPGLDAPPTPVNESRITDELKRSPTLVPPAVILPHGRMGASPTAIVLDDSGGKFGPFADSLFIGEQSHSQIQRVFTEQVDGVYQGAAWHFLKDFQCGIVPGKMAADGTMFVGGTNRGWGSRGTRGFSLERIRWTGRTPFEATRMKALHNGFELKFTEALDPETATDLSSYKMESWTYIYQSSYGSPEVDKTVPEVVRAIVSDHGKTLTLEVRGLVQGHVHLLDCAGLRSAEGRSLWHPAAYYTLNRIPEPPAPSVMSPPRPPNNWPKLPWPEKRELLTGIFAPTPADKQRIEEAVPRKATVTTDEPAEALLFWRCQYPHVSIATGNHALERMADSTGAYRVTLSDDPADFTPENLSKFDVVIFNNTTSYDVTLGEQGRAALLDYLKRGGGVVGIHAASDSCREWKEGIGVMGGVFKCHPWSPKGTWAFKLDEPGHPINSAFGGLGFRHRDEIYYYQPGSFSESRSSTLVSLDMREPENSTSPDLYPNVRQFATTDGHHPVSWIHQLGKGRIFYTNFGHNASTFWDGRILKHLLDGIQFAAGDLAAESAPSGEAANATPHR